MGEGEDCIYLVQDREQESNGRAVLRQSLGATHNALSCLVRWLTRFIKTQIFTRRMA
jgi:hypothetical protein